MADNPEKDLTDRVSGGDPMTGEQEAYITTLAKQALARMTHWIALFA
jgi:hypothetical protein